MPSLMSTLAASVHPGEPAPNFAGVPTEPATVVATHGGGTAAARQGVDAPQAVELARRAASGAFDVEVASWIAAGMRQWLAAGCALPLERVLRLPRSDARVRLADRNRLLRDAADLLEAATGPDVAAVLHQQWSQFISRGQWRRWQDAGGPTEDCGDLARALFYATLFNEGSCLSLKQLARVLADLRTRNLRDLSRPHQ